MYMSTKTHVLKKIDLCLSNYLPEDFHILWPKRLRAESTHPENWPKRPTYQGRNDPPPKLAETTQAETTQAETTQGRNDPDSSVAKLGYIPQFKASNARDQDEVSSDLARMVRVLSITFALVMCAKKKKNESGNCQRTRLFFWHFKPRKGI